MDAKPADAVVPAVANSNRTVMLVLSYLGLLSLIPYFVEKTDDEIRWHCRQGLVLALVSLGLGIVSFAMQLIPVIGLIVALVILLVQLAVIGVDIYCMVQALYGKRFAVPVISGFVAKLK